MNQNRTGGEQLDRSTPDANIPAVQRPPRRWLMWVVAGCCLVGAAITTHTLVDYVLWPRIPAALVGTWRVQEGPQKGLTLEFHSNGDFQARVTRGDEGAIVHARAEVNAADAKILRITSTHPQTGKATTQIHVIRSITNNELCLEDPSGMVSRLVRQE